MKKRLTIIVFIVFIFVLMGTVQILAIYDVLPSQFKILSLISSDFDINVNVTPNWHGGPDNFTATVITDNEVKLAWQVPIEARAVMIKVGYGRYPTNPTDGYMVYYGDNSTTNDLSVNLDATGQAYYSAFAEYDEGFSTGYKTQLVEGAGMLALSTIMEGILLLMVLAAIVVLAFWHRDPWLYVLAGFSLIIYGINFLGESYLSIILIILGIYCFFKALWDRRKKTKDE